MYGTVLTITAKYNRIFGQCRVLFGEMMLRKPQKKTTLQIKNAVDFSSYAAYWLQIKNLNYSQCEGRHEMFTAFREL
jgi:hypothetical protein